MLLRSFVLGFGCQSVFIYIVVVYWWCQSNPMFCFWMPMQEVQRWDCTQRVHSEEEGYRGARSTVECCIDERHCASPQPRGRIDATLCTLGILLSVFCWGGKIPLYYFNDESTSLQTLLKRVLFPSVFLPTLFCMESFLGDHHTLWSAESLHPRDHNALWSRRVCNIIFYFPIFSHFSISDPTCTVQLSKLRTFSYHNLYSLNSDGQL